MHNDIFGIAFRDYLAGDHKARLRIHNDVSDAEDLDVSYFFREYDQLPPWEKTAINLCRGRVLDVGAGAGSHSLILQQRDVDVTALDVSPGASEVMKKRGIKKVICQDFFNFNETGFDYLLFLMNGVGIAGNIDGLQRLVSHSRNLLKAGGCIILESTDLMYMFEQEDGSVCIPISGGYYGEINYQVEYQGKKGSSFPWIFADFDNLAEIAANCGFTIELLCQGDNYNYIARLTLEDIPDNVNRY